MKKLFSLVLSAVILTSAATLLASCSDNASAEDTTAATTAGTTVSTTATTTTTKPDTAPAPETQDPNITTSTGKDGVDDYNGVYHGLVYRDDEWSYKLFSMKYTGADGDRENPATYENDTMAEYMDSHNWTMGAETVPQSVLDDVKNWTTSYGPFGDDGDYNEVDIGFAGDNHGLIITQTFNIADVQELLEDFSRIQIKCHYDNTAAIYLNGTLVYRHFVGETNTPDWTGNYENLSTYAEGVGAYYIGDDAMRALLKDGDNTLMGMVKDGWGGRVLVLGMECDNPTV